MTGKSLAFFVLIILLVAAVGLSACAGQQTTQLLPTVVVNAPSEGATTALGQPVTVQSLSTSADGIRRVELWANGQQVKVDAPSSPQQSYSVGQQWTPPAEGTYALEVRAVDTKEQQALASVHISVLPAAGEPTQETRTATMVSETEQPPEPTPTSGLVDQIEPDVTDETLDASPEPSLAGTEETSDLTPTLEATAAPTVEATSPPTPLPGTATPTAVPPVEVQFWADPFIVSCDSPSTTLHWRVTGGTALQITLSSCYAATIGICDRLNVHQVNSREGSETVTPGDNMNYILEVEGYGPNLAPVAERTDILVGLTVPDSPAVAPWSAGPDFTDVSTTKACSYALSSLGLSSCSGSMVYKRDGTEVAVMAPSGIYVLNADGSQVRQLITPPGYSPGGEIAWSPYGEYIAYTYADSGILKVGVTRYNGTTPNDLWVINPEGTTDWPRWTTDQRLVVTSGQTSFAGNIYVVWMSGPPAEIHPVQKCETYEMTATESRQAYFPWGPGKYWIGGSPQSYESD